MEGGNEGGIGSEGVSKRKREGRGIQRESEYTYIRRYV